MILTDRALNPFDKTVSTQEGLQFMKSRLEATGIPHEISVPLHGPDGLPVKVCSLQFPTLGIGVNGKGLDDDAALASVYGEACERFTTGANRPHTGASYINQHSFSIMEGKRLAGYVKSESPLNPQIIDKICQHIPHTPELLEKFKALDMCTHWIDGYSIVTDSVVKVPSKVVAFLAGSNGLAAGTCLEEAVIQAAFEVFERYAYWELMRGKREIPIIPVESFGWQVKEMHARMKELGYLATFRDFSMGGKIPVIGIIVECIREPEGRVSRRMIVLGSSLNRDVAALRCITEYFQGWNCHIIDTRPRRVIPYTEWMRRPELFDSTLQTFTGDLRVLDTFQGTSEGYCYTGLNSTGDYINDISHICEGMGWDCILIDHTKPEIGVPVVRAIIPGISNIVNLQYNLVGHHSLTDHYMIDLVRDLTQLDRWVEFARTF